MEKEQLSRGLHAYACWRAEVVEQIRAYQRWLAASDNASMETDLRIDDVCEALRSDRIVIAFVAEFSRGKTELINAIFFSDYKRRLLPSDAGRTTMCPTELFYDHESGDAYIRLLPIETRLEDKAIAELKRTPDVWTTLALDVASPERMAETFREVVKVKKVPVDRAKALGLYEDEPGVTPPPQVEVPVWRHALISFPHPLLKQGLVILDTPGLNALGAEPELTVDMLPSAHAVVFVLGADTGGTKSDLEMWQQHVKQFAQGEHKGLLVALNKIDTLWDELEEPARVGQKIASQSAATARLLAINPDRVFPVSAQKGLLAKVRDDKGLLERSGLPGIEGTLSHDILPYKQKIVRDRVVSDIGSMVRASRDGIAARHEATRKQLAELRALGGKNVQMIQHLMKTTREESIGYRVRLENFQTSRAVFTKLANDLLEHLDIKALDAAINKSREMMVGTWTTHGMKTEMKAVFDQVNQIMVQVGFAAEQANEAVVASYKRFREDFGLADLQPIVYQATTYQHRLERLSAQAEEFRNSPVTTMTEQGFVVKRFFISMVSHARDIISKARAEADVWSKSALAPLAMEVKEHRRDLEQRMENLKRISESRETIEAKIKELEAQNADLEKQLSVLKVIDAAVHRPVATDEEVPPARAAVAS